MKISEIMRGGAVTCSPEDTAAHAALLLNRYNVGMLPVTDSYGRLRGVVTDRDIVIRCVAAGEDARQTAVREVMSRNTVCASPSDDAEEAVRTMLRAGVRRMPVCEDGTLVGIVSLGDMAREGRLAAGAGAALAGITSNVRRL